MLMMSGAYDYKGNVCIFLKVIQQSQKSNLVMVCIISIEETASWIK